MAKLSSLSSQSPIVHPKKESINNKNTFFKRGVWRTTWTSWSNKCTKVSQKLTDWHLKGGRGRGGSYFQRSSKSWFIRQCKKQNLSLSFSPSQYFRLFATAASWLFKLASLLFLLKSSRSLSVKFSSLGHGQGVRVLCKCSPASGGPLRVSPARASVDLTSRNRRHGAQRGGEGWNKTYLYKYKKKEAERSVVHV